MGRALLAGCAYFALVFAAGFALGVVRSLFLAPALGHVGAVLVELPVILAVAWLAARWTVRRLAVPSALGMRAAMGALAFALLMVAELTLSVHLLGRTPGQHWAAYATLPAQLGLAGQVAFAAMPLAVRR
ncbi:hypothetical protein [Salinarimonas ramus]|uniref:Uncharacterized protein n=1 Tax=Salinarimonas ramus TaxID=690164 RepID=A0A917Q7U4_9HYPH|nr:hypothetical protein [Salinarimonas ramus]GGK32768.1 hypothetical protein GCM10011322_19340 [Salinarimonas ramus]